MMLRTDVTLTETTEGGVLLDGITGDCFALNKLGLHVWHHIAAGRTFDEIVERLSTAFEGVPRNVLSRDVGNFIAALEQQSLLTP